MLIPYLAADCACYAFQVAEYAKHFTCISVDLRGAEMSDKPAGAWSTEMFADDIAAFMQARLQRRMSTGSRSAQPRESGSQPGIPSSSNHFLCTVRGRKAMPTCSRWCRAGRPWPERSTTCRTW